MDWTRKVNPVSTRYLSTFKCHRGHRLLFFQKCHRFFIAKAGQ